MEFIPLRKCIKTTSTDGTILTEHQLNTSRRPWTPERTRKISAKPGRMKERREKEKERKQDRLCTPEGELKQRRGSHIRGSPLTDGEIIWDRRGALRLLEEGEMASLWQTGQSETYTGGPCHSPVHHRLGCVSTCAHGD